MPNWKQEIRRRLADQPIDPAREESIIEELSQHIEDRYQELLSAGGSEPEVCERVLEELAGSESFAAALPAAKSRFSPNAMPAATLASGNLFSDLQRDLRFGL